jgi:hypothetical protein
MVALRLAWELGVATTSLKAPPTAGALVVKAPLWEVKAEAVAKRAARQKNLIVLDIKCGEI